MTTNGNFSAASPKHSPRDVFVQRLATEIESNLNNDKFGVDSLSQAVGMSRSSLHRKLHKTLGISTSQFIREYRLKRALELLREEDITSSEAGYRVGFSSATYFSTCFHKFYGYTPGDVKSREISDAERPIQNDSTPVEKKRIKKRALWLALAALALITTSFYFYNSGAKENSENAKATNLTDEKSIAVLPFKNWTGNPDLEYISDGMTDAVISRLTKIGALDKVTPFTSTLQYKESKKTIMKSRPNWV